MRFWHIHIFWILLIVCSGCGFLQKPLSIDNNLPTIQKIQTLSDVSNIAFEWQGQDMTGMESSVEGFVIYRASEEELKDVQLDSQIPLEKFKRIATIKNPFVTHFYDTKLKPKSTYYYVFTTLGKDNTQSNYSQALKVRTSFIDPVEGVFALSNRPKTIKLIITPHSNPSIRSYIVQRQNPQGEFVAIGELKNRFNIEFFDTNLNDGTTYTYRVLAKDFEGNVSEASDEVSIRTLDLIQSVQGVSATTNIPLKIELSWEAHPKAKYYRIYADIAQDGTYKLLANTQNTSYTHTLKEHGQSVAYQIVGVDMYGFDGELLKSPIIGSTLSRPQTPNIIDSQVQGNAIVIYWDTPSDGRAKKYAVYRKDPQTNRSNRYKNIRTTHFTDKETKRGIDYTYSVVSIDEFDIESPQSQSVTLSR